MKPLTAPPIARWERESPRPELVAARLRECARAGRSIPATLEELAPVMRAMTSAQIERAVAIAREAACLPRLTHSVGTDERDR